MPGAGSLRERLTIQTDRPLAIEISALTWAGGMVSVTTRTPHGYTTSDYVTVAGATPSGYNGKVKITVTGASAFTYPVTGPLTTPATGALSVTYFSDPRGDVVSAWRTLTTVWAEMMPLRASERLQLAAIQSDTTYRFRVRVRSDLAPTMRALWTPRWPRGMAQRILSITGVLPDGNGLQYQMLECAEAPS